MITKRTGATALSLVCTMALAAGLAGYSPITCGCIDPWKTIGYGLTGSDPSSPDALTVEYIRGNLFAKYYGKRVTANGLPSATSPSDCASVTTPTPSIRCRWWLWHAPGRKKGFDVAVETDDDGLFRSVQVVEIEYIDPKAKVTPDISLERTSER